MDSVPPFWRAVDSIPDVSNDLLNQDVLVYVQSDPNPGWYPGKIVSKQKSSLWTVRFNKRETRGLQVGSVEISLSVTNYMCSASVSHENCIWSLLEKFYVR
eukprot:Pompholyxophrys_punicea_v1_NODE_376_length_2093_cov_35.121153.p5 type:complete len:101 gc:universal NODE_376_length_2093_cov_35.121153:386-84(-)